MKGFYKTGGVRLIMIVVIIVMWIAGEAVFRLLLPEYGFGMYPAVPALFLIFALALTVFISAWDRKVRAGAMHKQKVLACFMMFKMAKLLVSAIAIFCYFKFVGYNNDAFLLTFAIYYMVFLALESFAIYGFERRIKAIDN
jgi:hypothetical protein